MIRVRTCRNPRHCSVCVDPCQEVWNHGDRMLPSCLPLLFEHGADLETIHAVGVAAHDYYRPLAPRPRAQNLHSRIACLPARESAVKVLERHLAEWARP